MIYVKIKVMVYKLQLIILSNCNKLYDHGRIDYIYLNSSCKTLTRNGSTITAAAIMARAT